MKYYTNNTVLAWHWKLIFVESRHTQPHIIDNAFVNTFFRRNLLFNVYTNKWNATCCLQNRIGIDSIIVNVKCCMSPITTVNINSTPAHTKYIQFWKMYQWSIWLLAVSFYSSLPMYFIWPIKLRVKYQIIKCWRYSRNENRSIHFRVGMSEWERERGRKSGCYSLSTNVNYHFMAPKILLIIHIIDCATTIIIGVMKACRWRKGIRKIPGFVRL